MIKYEQVPKIRRSMEKSDQGDQVHEQLSRAPHSAEDAGVQHLEPRVVHGLDLFTTFVSRVFARVQYLLLVVTTCSHDVTTFYYCYLCFTLSFTLFHILSYVVCMFLNVFEGWIRLEKVRERRLEEVIGGWSQRKFEKV